MKDDARVLALGLILIVGVFAAAFILGVAARIFLWAAGVS